MPANDASIQNITPPPAVQLQPRDYRLLRSLFECRTMTLSQATALFFEGRYEAARKRIQILRRAGYIGDKRRKIGEESVLFLTKLAFERLSADGRLTDHPSLTPKQFLTRSQVKDSTIRHELSVMDVRVALTTAPIASGKYRVDTFTTWPLLSQFEAIHPTERQRVLLRPDGFLCLTDTQAKTEFSFFLELDRSTEVQRLLAEKALCYRDFYTSGGFALRSGGAAADFRDYPFRVLMVLQTAERRNNTAERLMNCTPPIKFQTWLTTREEVLSDPLGKIWVSPMDYAVATENTIYAPEHCRNGSSYIRRPERERLVEERVVKRTLFDEAQIPPTEPAV